jgi:hypothetical protein
MSKLYAGSATVTLPDGTSVDANVDLWTEETGPLVQWGGTAESNAVGNLWNGDQRICTIAYGDADSGLRVGECMIIEMDPEAGEDVDRVTVRGSGDFAQVVAGA